MIRGGNAALLSVFLILVVGAAVIVGAVALFVWMVMAL